MSAESNHAFPVIQCFLPLLTAYGIRIVIPIVDSLYHGALGAILVLERKLQFSDLDHPTRQCSNIEPRRVGLSDALSTMEPSPRSGTIVPDGLWLFVSPCTSYTDLCPVQHCCIRRIVQRVMGQSIGVTLMQCYPMRACLYEAVYEGITWSNMEDMAEMTPQLKNQ